MQFRVFFKVKVQNWDIFWFAKSSNIFLGCLKFLIFFWDMSHDMIFPNLWYVRPAKAQTNLRIRVV